MDDLIKRLRIRGAQAYERSNHYVRRMEVERIEAAAAITESQATIVRQQVMLDRALEDIGEKMVEIARLRGALKLAIGLGRDLGMTDMEEDAIRDKAALNTPETAPPE